MSNLRPFIDTDIFNRHARRAERLLKAKIRLGVKWQGHPGYLHENNPWHPQFGAKLQRKPNGKFPIRIFGPCMRGPYAKDWQAPTIGVVCAIVFLGALLIRIVSDYFFAH